MDEITRRLSDGNIAAFDVGTPQDVIDRYIAHYEAVQGNKDDSYTEMAGKTLKTVGRGLGEGAAQTADLPFQAGQYLYEVGKNLWEEGHGRPYERKPVAAPFTEEYNRLAGDPIPGYESINDWTATLGPAVVESVATLGAGTIPAVTQALTRQGVKSALRTGASEAGRIAVRAPVRAAATTGAGIGGAELGQNLGQRMGGDIGAEIGGGLGGMFAGAISPAAKAAIKKKFFDPKSEQRLADANRLNAKGAGIPVTGGLLSPKKLGAREDRLARNPLSGGARAIETRRGQYEGLDRALQQVAERLRGHESGGPITKASIGNDLVAMLADADVAVTDKMTALQENLAKQAGLLSDTDAMEIDAALKGVAQDKTLSAAQRDQAARLRTEIRKNYQAPPLGPDMQGPSSPTMTYGATKQVRSELGSQIKDEDLSQLVNAPSYEALTKMMKDTYNSSGGPLDFDQQQQVYQEWKKQQKEIRQKRGIKGKDNADTAGFDPEAASYDKMLGGGNKGSVRQLAPYEEHTPQQLDAILADALELETRGENAGVAPDPERFDPTLVGKNYESRSPEWKQKVTRGDITAQEDMKAIGNLAKAESSRPGKRSVPDRTGSTIGEGADYSNRTAMAVLLNLPGYLASRVAAPAWRYAQSHALTNEPNLQRLFQKEPIASTIGRGAAGADIGAKYTSDTPTPAIGSSYAISDEEDDAFGQKGRVVDVSRDGSMVRMVMPDGSLRQIGSRLLTPAEEGR